MWRKGAINVKFLRSLSVLLIIYEKECQNENKLRDDICKKKHNRKRIMQSKAKKRKMENEMRMMEDVCCN